MGGTNKGKSLLDEFTLSLNMSDIMLEEYEGNIFHYTSTTGFNSILFGDGNEITLWASRYDCLNDVSEGKIARAIYNEVCEELKTNGEITAEQYDILSSVSQPRTILFSKFNEKGEYKGSRKEYESFICSFSKNDDSLAMWNYYSKGNRYEGYSIGVQALEIRDYLGEKYDGEEVKVHICPVLYRKEEQKREVKRILLNFIERYEKGQETSIRYWVSEKLLHWSLVFKSEYFAHEEELKTIVDIAKHIKDGKIVNRAMEVKYRNNFGYVVPYIELKVSKEALTSVKSGPLQCDKEQKETQREILNEMLKEKGYKQVASYSGIPVRF